MLGILPLQQNEVGAFNDGVLSDIELNDFQVEYLKGSLSRSQIQILVKLLQRNYPEGVNECVLTLAGFQSLFVGLLKFEDREIPWTMQRKFGYPDGQRLR
ncbi:EF hand associated protein [Medicago truncatula]|uniref:EF hand associated protein n=1 Tax=Medicago truncatula TaxID=3880 RepID=A0A072UQ01_MEDTR|nr:EF hand associated protein [Medicago truncatula]